MKTWFAIIILSSFGFLAFANMATDHSGGDYEARLPDEILHLTRAQLEQKAHECVHAKREALRISDHARYLELVNDMACHHAELVVLADQD
ncbi:hypothetical protein [Endothiovibrio diazotrophicus]